MKLKKIVQFSSYCILSSITAISLASSLQRQLYKYRNYSIEQFVKKRYTTHNIFAKALGSVNHVLGAVDNTIGTSGGNSYNILDHTYKVMPDGKSVLYPITFDSYSGENLYKPESDMQTLCNIQGGNLTLVYPFSTNLLDLPAEYIDDQDATNGSYSNAHVTAYNNALNNHAFGYYYCQTNHKKLWNIGIIPIAYRNESHDETTVYAKITPNANIRKLLAPEIKSLKLFYKQFKFRKTITTSNKENFLLIDHSGNVLKHHPNNFANIPNGTLFKLYLQGKNGKDNIVDLVDYYTCKKSKYVYSESDKYGYHPFKYAIVCSPTFFAGNGYETFNNFITWPSEAEIESAMSGQAVSNDITTLINLPNYQDMSLTIQNNGMLLMLG